MKRISAVILCVIMILSFSGCAPKNNTSKQASSGYVQDNSSEQASSEYLQDDSSEQTSSGYVQGNSSEQASSAQDNSSEQTSSGYIQNNNTSEQFVLTQNGYLFQTKQYSFYIPESWKGKFITDHGTTFYSKSNHNAIYTGLIFAIDSSNKEYSWRGVPSHRYLGFADGTYYYMYLPSDVQFDDSNPECEEEYTSMYRDIGNIKNSFKLYGNNVSYDEPQ